MKQMDRWFRNLKYRYKITLLVLAAGILPVVIMAVYFLRGMIETTRSQEMDNMESVIEQAVDTMTNQANIYENLVDYLSYSRELRDIVGMEPQSDYLTYLEYVEVIDPLLQMPQVYHNEIAGITLYSESIEVPHGNMLLPLSQAEGESWYSKLEDSSRMQWTVIRGNSPRITVSRRFYDDEESTAVLAITLDYDAMLRPFTDRLAENMGGLILDSDGNVVYSSVLMEEKYHPEQPESLEYIRQNYSYCMGEMEETGWTFCLYRPTQLITDSVVGLILQSLPVLILCILALAVVGYFFSKGLVQPLERLTENINQIQLGFRKVTVSSVSNDEVGVLIRSFRRLMDEMNRLISEVYESKIKLQNTEMKALQAQINPHFLYNSLSIINWKALEADQEDISKVTLALSTYYRTSLNRGETMTTVENEINNIRAYLGIQLIMHDNSFKVIEDIDMDAGGYRIPKLILQPLVENSIDHGLDMSEKEEKCLWLTVSQDGNDLLFEVRDNGVGMEQEKADEIVSYHSKGYGLRNVYERIRVLYGEEGNMDITSCVGEGTRIQIRVPKKTEEKK